MLFELVLAIFEILDFILGFHHIISLSIWAHICEMHPADFVIYNNTIILPGNKTRKHIVSEMRLLTFFGGGDTPVQTGSDGCCVWPPSDHWTQPQSKC